MASLKLEDFSDRELLYALEEHADGQGLCSSQELAEGLGLDKSKTLKHPTQNIAIRLSWLKRYGVVYRDEESRRWGLTPVGQRILHSKLKAAERRALEELDPEKLLVVMKEIGASMMSAGDEAMTMATRDFRYTTAARKRSR